MAAENYSQGKGISHADNRQEHVLKHLSEEEGARILDPNATDDVIAELESVADARAAEVDDAFDEADESDETVPTAPTVQTVRPGNVTIPTAPRRRSPPRSAAATGA